jgi:hypothetical protein
VTDFVRQFGTIKTDVEPAVQIQCVRKVAVHLQKVLEVMSASDDTGLKPFNFIRKHFLQICL